MTHEERLLWLARQEVECPVLVEAIFGGTNDSLMVHELRQGHAACDKCNGTGKAPHFPICHEPEAHSASGKRIENE